jgi:hypothetical protein
MKSLIVTGMFHGFEVALDSNAAKLITPHAIRAPASLQKKIRNEKSNFHNMKLIPSSITIWKTTFTTIISYGM